VNADTSMAATSDVVRPASQSRRRRCGGAVSLVICAAVLGWSNLQASAAQSVLRCGGEAVTLRGTHGSDHLVGTSGADVIWGGPGGDTIRGRGGNDVVCAGSGADVVTTGLGSDVVYGGRGPDFIADPGGGRLTVHGGRGNDVIQDNGTARSDFSSMWGGRGDDYIIGGDSESPYLVGGRGNDVLRGRGGDAEMVTGPGHDVAYAGTGRTQVSLTGDGDVYVGGPREDTAMYTGARSAVRASLVTGRGRLMGRKRADVLINVEGVYGSPYDDVLLGDAQANHLYGDVGNDTIRGGDGADIVQGGDGDDTLRGGLPSGTAPWPVGDQVEGENGRDNCAGGETTLSCES
jgi:Ca2+-binding RTX toxin-like protein